MKKLFLILISVIFFASCIKDYDDLTNNDFRSNPRISLKNQNIPVVPGFGLKSQPQIDYVFTLVAEVDAPSIASQTLQATHVDVYNNTAYVSYNMRGSQNLGAIDIIDITNPSAPIILNTLLFDDKDVNTVKFVDGYIYFGGQDIDGGYVAKVDSDLDGSDIVIFSWGEQTNPYSLNSMDSDNNNIWFTGGDNGGLYIVDPDDDGDGIITVYEIFDARSVKSLSNGEIYVLSGNDVYLWNGEFMSELGLIESNWVQQHSKADLDANEDYLFAATNRGGGLIVDIRNTPPVVSQRIERPLTPEGMDDEDYVTNSVSVNNELLFWAQGGAGIIVCEVTPYDEDDKSLPVQELGYFDFGGPLSSNFVMSQDNYIFVATGLGGLKILTMVQIDDNPDDPDECEWQEETAFAGSDLGGGNAWWYYFINTSIKASHPIYAGQTLVEGAYAIYMDGVLTIELGDKMRLQEGDETVKIQGYNEGELPSSRPPAGLFTTYKGNDLVIDLQYYPYYVIHLDVEVCWE